MDTPVGVRHCRLEDFIASIRPSQPIRQIKADLPRMQAYVDDERVMTPRDLLLRLDHMEVPQSHLFFQQATLAPVVNQISLIRNGHVVDSRSHVHIRACTKENSIDIYKRMLVYSLDLSRKLGAVGISIYVNSTGVWQVVEFSESSE
jgi:hypothetical protein